MTDKKQKQEVTKEHIIELLKERRAALKEVEDKYEESYNHLTEEYLKKVMPEAFAGVVFELKDEYKKEGRKVVEDKIWVNHCRLIHFVDKEGTVQEDLEVIVHGWFMDGENCVLWNRRGLSLKSFREKYVKSKDQTFNRPDSKEDTKNE